MLATDNGWNNKVRTRVEFEVTIPFLGEEEEIDFFSTHRPQRLFQDSLAEKDRLCLIINTKIIRQRSRIQNTRENLKNPESIFRKRKPAVPCLVYFASSKCWKFANHVVNYRVILPKVHVYLFKRVQVIRFNRLLVYLKNLFDPQRATICEVCSRYMMAEVYIIPSRSVGSQFPLLMQDNYVCERHVVRWREIIVCFILILSPISIFPLTLFFENVRWIQRIYFVKRYLPTNQFSVCRLCNCILNQTLSDCITLRPVMLVSRRLNGH